MSRFPAVFYDTREGRMGCNNGSEIVQAFIFVLRVDFLELDHTLDECPPIRQMCN